ATPRPVLRAVSLSSSFARATCRDRRFPSSLASWTSSSAVPGRWFCVLCVGPVLTWKTLLPSCTAGRATQPGAAHPEGQPERLDWKSRNFPSGGPELARGLAHPPDGPHGRGP